MSLGPAPQIVIWRFLLDSIKMFAVIFYFISLYYYYCLWQQLAPAIQARKAVKLKQHFFISLQRATQALCSVHDFTFNLRDA